LTVYVDQLRVAIGRDTRTRLVGARHGHRWCHMLADTLAELLAFAKRLGLRPEWLDRDHFDLLPFRRERALTLGAVEVSTRELVRVRRRIREGK
jgi:hypothetical protein